MESEVLQDLVMGRDIRIKGRMTVEQRRSSQDVYLDLDGWRVIISGRHLDSGSPGSS
jgi:hypothetical protein